jgi:ferredoxin-thioredoxin reductase catalytic subunit
MKVEELYEFLKKAQEPKGYFFNQNRDKTLAILTELLENKLHYGYMGCPCRLLSGDPDWDRDIICPCTYRELDVKEYGSCYCGLYVSESWNAGTIPHNFVPERRPADKILGPDN